jgi:sortase A
LVVAAASVATHLAPVAAANGWGHATVTPPIAVVQPAASPAGNLPSPPLEAQRAPGARSATAAWAAVSPARLAARRVALAVTAVGVLATLLFVYEFQLSSIPQARLQAELLATFKQLVPTTTLDAPSTAPADGTPVAYLRIPRRGISQVVVEGSTPSDLKMGPGHLSASPLPGEYGNSVIEGRRTTYGSPFGKLDSVHKGDVIDVITGQGSFTYTVSKLVTVGVGESDVVAGTKSSRLTLLTSEPAYVATGRLAVIATLKGKPVAVPTRPAALMDATQLGLAGDPVGLALGVVWLNLLIGAVFISWRLRRRLPWSVLYLFAAPVITTLALLTYVNLDSLLPGTM